MEIRNLIAGDKSTSKTNLLIENKEGSETMEENKIFDGKEAKKLYKKGEDRLEYLDQYGEWQIFDHKFDRASMFGFYDKWRTY